MHPADWEAIDLLKDNEGRYYSSGPGSVGPQILWNLMRSHPSGHRVCRGLAQGDLVGPEQASVTVSDSHGDFFIRNLVAILAEMRCAFGVIQPSAFVRIELRPGN